MSLSPLGSHVRVHQAEFAGRELDRRRAVRRKPIQRGSRYLAGLCYFLILGVHAQRVTQ